MFNKHTGVVMESVNVTIEDIEHNKSVPRNLVIEDVEYSLDTVTPPLIELTTKDESITIADLNEGDVQTITKLKKSESRILKNYPMDAIFGNIKEGRKTRGKRNVDYHEMVRMITWHASLSQLSQRISKR